MWPLPDDMVVQATGDTRAVPILWGPTLFYYCNILIQFSMVFALFGWMAYSYYTEREERRPEERGKHSGDSKQEAKEKEKRNESPEKATADDSDKENACAKAAAEEMDLLNSDQPRAQGTVSDEALVRRKASEEVRRNASEDQLAPPWPGLSAATNTPKTGSLERLLKDSQVVESSDSELESEVGDTPGMAVRRRRSKRLLHGDSAAQ